jgi:hypothetical protein
MGQSVKLIATGKAAMERVSLVLKLAQPVIVPSALGSVQLVPGTIWSGNKMLILVQGSTTYSTIDDRLYEWSTSDFIREEWIAAEQKGMRSAKDWVVIAQIEMALLSGMFVPWYILLAATCAQVGLFYAGNKQNVDLAMKQGGKVIEKLRKLHRDCPKLFRVLETRVAREVWTELKQGHGIEAKDIAFFIGRVIKGVSSTPQLTLTAFFKIVTQVGSLVSLTHSPGILIHAAESAAKRAEENLVDYMRSIGYTVTVDEAKEIMREVRSNPMSERNLKDLATDLRAIVPTLQTLGKAWEKAWDS